LITHVFTALLKYCIWPQFSNNSVHYCCPHVMQLLITGSCNTCQ